MHPVVILDHGKEKPVLKGHPWIFPKAIAKSTGVLVTGDLVDVFDAKGHLIAKGIYNEHSLYRVRVLLLATEIIADPSLVGIITHRLHQALKVRHAINLPCALTTVFRLFNSEADGLSGLTVDCFGHVVVVSSTAFWVQQHQATIQAVLHELLGNIDILWVPQVKSLKQDGWTVAESEVTVPHIVEVKENGIIYRVDFALMQKTGLYIDQRENHQRIASLAEGKRVLDLYTYTGGFALHAAKAGATHVTAVDSSKAAIDMARENAQLNHLSQIEFVVADSRDYLDKAGDYDLIILDPPKLVPSRRHVEQAKNYYRFLHREIFKFMQTGSLLLTCNCSSALSMSEFLTLVTSQASPVGKQVRVLGSYGPSSCHPVLASFPEGNYLTAVLLAIV